MSDHSLPAGRQTEILIVGAGLTGLMAAVTLVESGRTITLLDKGPSVGGRLATRRIGPGRADHGAQFFTVRSPQFNRCVREWLTAGLVYQWATGWGDGSLNAAPTDGYPRYAVRGGMNALAKHLADQVMAAGATIHTGARALTASPVGDGWRVVVENGPELHASQLVLTSPAPQSLALLAAGETMLAPDDRAYLDRIRYAPCLCGLFWLEGDVHLPEPGAIQRPDSPIAWIADNQRKGISPEARLITAHGGPEWSQEHYDAGDETILSTMHEALLPWLGADAIVVESQVKRWRYALPTAIHPHPYLKAAGLPALYFAGDAFGGPRMEGAALSGMATAEAILGPGQL
jgi:hypothetical protein